MIDLSKVKIKQKSVVAPVYRKYAYNKSFCIKKNLLDGWYELLSSNSIPSLLVGQHIKRSHILYHWNGIFVPHNTDQFKDIRPKKPLLSPSLPDFSKINCVYIRKKMFYISHAVDVDLLARSSELKIERNQGDTPEKLLLVGLFNIEQHRLSQQRLLQDKENSLEFRLKAMFSLNNADMISFNKIKDVVDVIWQVFDEQFLTTFDIDTLQVTPNSAGFCISGQDDDFTAASLPAVARIAINGGGLYRTRNVS